MVPYHGEELLRQGVVVREELEGRGGGQGGGGLVVVVVVAVAEATAHRELLAQELHLVLDPLQGLCVCVCGGGKGGGGGEKGKVKLS